MIPHEYQRNDLQGTRRKSVMQTVVDCGILTGPMLAKEEFLQQAIAEADQQRLLREAGITRAGPHPLLAVRRALGATLIALGERIRGARAAAAPAEEHPVSTLPGLR
jgi:hypothetical protein